MEAWHLIATFVTLATIWWLASSLYPALRADYDAWLARYEEHERRMAEHRRLSEHGDGYMAHWHRFGGNLRID